MSLQLKCDKLQFLFASGVTASDDLRKLVEMPERSFRWNMAIVKRGATLERSGGSNRPLALSSDDRRSLSQLANLHSSPPARELVKRLVDKGRPYLSARLVQRHLKQSGFEKLAAQEVLDLSNEQKLKG